MVDAIIGWPKYCFAWDYRVSQDVRLLLSPAHPGMGDPKDESWYNPSEGLGWISNGISYMRLWQLFLIMKASNL